MPSYMTQFAYTNAATASFIKNPEDRSGAFREQVEELRGKVIAFYHCIGEYDGVAIYELPDEASVAGLLFAIRAPGTSRSFILPNCIRLRSPWRECVRQVGRRTGGH